MAAAKIRALDENTSSFPGDIGNLDKGTLECKDGAFGLLSLENISIGPKDAC